MANAQPPFAIGSPSPLHVPSHAYRLTFLTLLRCASTNSQVLEPSAGQQDVFSSGVKDVIDDIMNGCEAG